MPAGEAGVDVSIRPRTEIDRLLALCVLEPEQTGEALRIAIDAGGESGALAVLLEIATAAGRARSDLSGADGSACAGMLPMAAKLVEQGDFSRAGALIALMRRLGSDTEGVAALSGTIAADLTRAMRAALADGDDDAAARMAQTLTGVAPDAAEGWQTSGRLKLKAGDPQGALDALRTAVALHDQSQNTLLNLARAEAACGLYQEAILSLFKLQRISESGDGRYRPLAVAQLESLFAGISTAAVEAERANDAVRLLACFNMLSEIAQSVSGSLIEYVVSSRNIARTATGFARVALAVGQGRQGIDVCDAAIELEQENAGLWSALGRMRLHYHENRQAIHAFRQALDLAPDQPSVMDGLAEALFREGDADAALETLRKALTLDGASSAIRTRLERIEAAQAARTDGMADGDAPRHIEILGLPNQGNAHLGAVLAARSGVHYVGESIWLAGQQDGEAQGDARFASCQLCKRPDCDVFDLAFRQALTDDRKNWFTRIAAQCGAEVLVTTDNSPQIARTLDPSVGGDCIIAFRSPASAWGVLKQHYSASKRALPSLLQFLQGWHRTYATALHDFPSRGAKTAFDLDRLDGSGADGLADLQERLGLGGAGQTGVSGADHVFGVTLSEIEQAPVHTDIQLTAAEKKVIEGFADAARLYDELVAAAV